MAYAAVPDVIVHVVRDEVYMLRRSVPHASMRSLRRSRASFISVPVGVSSASITPSRCSDAVISSLVVIGGPHALFGQVFVGGVFAGLPLALRFP